MEMLRDAGLGVCMQNGRDDVKAVSNHTSQWTNDQDGVGRELELLLEAGAFD
jgi:hydroxymethylpyrimidine pyrophosphatase-like HAD family hydrolase